MQKAVQSLTIPFSALRLAQRLAQRALTLGKVSETDLPNLTIRFNTTQGTIELLLGTRRIALLNQRTRITAE